MPVASITLARDSIVSTFKTAWDAQTPPIPLLIFDDAKQDIPSGGTPFARITVRHNLVEQATLGGIGGRRFRRFGIVAIEIYTPAGEGLTDADKFAKVALDAFEGKNTGGDAIEFRNTRVNEVGQDGPWFQTNVLADFEYDEVK